MKILFHNNHLDYRGTSVSVYNYAHYNETLLGNESVIIYNSTSPYNREVAFEHFNQRFKVRSYSNLDEFYQIIAEEKPDFFYAQKYGFQDGVVTNQCKSGIHVVFKSNDPHGDVYAYISDWLAKESGGSKDVPYIVDLPNTDETLHHELGIPREAKVFGCYGGADSFDIQFVREEVANTAYHNPNIYFIFMGMDKFVELPNVIFLPANTDSLYKVKFINTCNAMIHARRRGETFGMAIAEFAIKGKPVITYGASPETAHNQFLGDKGYYYYSRRELANYFLNSDLSKNPQQNYLQFLPENVMQTFKRVFLEG